MHKLMSNVTNDYTDQLQRPERRIDAVMNARDIRGLTVGVRTIGTMYLLTCCDIE